MAASSSAEQQGERLMEACRTGNLPLVREIAASVYKAGIASPLIPPPAMALHNAAENGHADVLRYLFTFLPACHASPQPYQPLWPVDTSQMPSEWRRYTEEPYQLLHDAVRSGSVDTMAAILETGIEPDTYGERDVPPLSNALRNRDWTMAEFLISKGAKPNPIWDLSLETCLQHAAATGDELMLDFLVEHGTDLQGSGALFAAAQTGNTKGGRKLLQLGADVNELAVDHAWVDGQRMQVRKTALQEATLREHREFVSMLLDHGADVDAKNDDGGTAA